MKAIFNGVLKEIDDIPLSPGNRGFKYADGIFETIAYSNGKPRLLAKHLQRLQKGMELLMLRPSYDLQVDKIESMIQDLRLANSIDKSGKSKLYVFRDADGLYMPESDNASFILTLENSNYPIIDEISNSGICQSTRNFQYTFSHLKTMNALNYVMAGMERRTRKLDEILIKDSHGHISEGLTSNIFIKVNEEYFTPPLSTGCIEGVMRNWLIDSMTSEGISVQEKLFDESELSKATSVFTTNSGGLRHLLNIEGSSFQKDVAIERYMHNIE